MYIRKVEEEIHTYMDNLPETEVNLLLRHLHYFITTYGGIRGKIRFTTPFYDGNFWLCYLSKLKKGGVEVCFVHANRFTKHVHLLDFKKRKQVAGITYFNPDEINPEELDLLMQEAIDTDTRMQVKKQARR